MHIPKSDTQHTEILTFEEAQKHREESAVYDRENGFISRIFTPNTVTYWVPPAKSRSLPSASTPRQRSRITSTTH